jgi:hypothetical protein
MYERENEGFKLIRKVLEIKTNVEQFFEVADQQKVQLLALS